MNIFARVIKEKRKMELWIFFHIICLSIAGCSIYFAIKYINEPVTVLIVDRAGNIHIGTTTDIRNEKVLKNLTKRFVYAFFNRTFAKSSDRSLRCLLTTKALAKAKQLQQRYAKDFKEKSIIQSATIAEMRVIPQESFELVLVTGTISQEGVFFGETNIKKIQFKAMLCFERNLALHGYPFKIFHLKIKFIEESE